MPLTLQWYQHHVMSTAPSITPLMIKIQCIITFLSCDTIGVIPKLMWCWQCCQWQHCISLVKTIGMRYNMTFWSFHAIGMDISVTCCQQHHQWYQYTTWVWQIELRCNIFCHVMPLMLPMVSDEANSVRNSTTAFPRLMKIKLKWGATWLF